jgi:hypothetical protein
MCKELSLPEIIPTARYEFKKGIKKLKKALPKTIPRPTV